MTEKFELSRRKALLGLGTIGLAGAGAGVGTSALFTDEESFEDNTMVAGELDLFVDYWTSQNTNTSSTDSGTNDGGVSALIELTDVKPGDDGKVVFCPKIVDNPAYLWAGSGGLTQYENGYTEPEGEAEDMNATDDSIEGRSLNGSDPEDEYPVADVDDGDSPTGEGYGELADNVQVTVSYCEPSDDLDSGEEPSSPDDFQEIRQLNNPEDYTLADLILELQTGFPISNNEDGTYPASDNEDDQAGVCLCIEWDVPIDVGNWIQSDSVEFDIGFSAVQSRNVGNPAAENPYAQVFTTNRAFSGTDSQNGDFSDPISLPYDGLGEEQRMAVSLSSDPVVICINTAKDLVGGTYPDNFGVAFETNGDNTGDFQVKYTEGTGFEYEEPVASGTLTSLPAEISATQVSGDEYVIQIDRSKLNSTFSLGGKVGYASETPPSGSGNVVVNLTPEFTFGPTFTEADAYREVTLE